MLKAFLLLITLVAGKYYLCDDKGHACKEGTTCCKRKGNDYGCCPLESAVCCADSDGHCCPLGYPICDIVHKKCTNHLSFSQPISLKSDALSVKDASDFFIGLATGTGIRLDQYSSCIGEFSIGFSLLQQALNYMQGDTALDNFIVLKKIGESLQHFSLGGFNCNGAVQGSVNVIKEFFDGSQDKSEMYWQIIQNIMVDGNLMLREADGILTSDWKEKGYKTGKLLTYIFRFS